jgi:hypothetical protein
MSLIDDARKMAADCPNATDRGGRGECYYCFGGNYAGGYLSGSPTESEFHHAPDCPWLSMPKIVAALEAAERLKIYRPAALSDDRYQCQFCGATAAAYPMDHESECPWQALVAALRGESS